MYIHIANHIELDREQRSVRKDGQIVHLTGLEYGLLAPFMPDTAAEIAKRLGGAEMDWDSLNRFGVLNPEA